MDSDQPVVPSAQECSDNCYQEEEMNMRKLEGFWPGSKFGIGFEFAILYTART